MLTSADTPALALRGASKSFGTTEALLPCHLDIAPHKNTVFIGPSGCGKSTVLRLMIGLLRPDEGEVLVRGTSLTKQNIRKMRHHMGYVIQEGGLFPHLSARENIVLLARHLGWSVEKISSRLKELLELVRLPEKLIERYPLELSGGQRQRISLMRALMLDPQILLLDEPLGALDPMIRFDLQEDLRRIFTSLRKTVLMVTHDMGEAYFFGDEIVLMRDGAVIQKGPFSDLANAPSEPFVTEFIRAQRSPLEEALHP